MNFGVIGGGRESFDCALMFGHATLDEMLASRDLDAIVVSTPSATHFEIAPRVVDAGTPVVIEKPVCLVPEEFETLRLLCAEKELPAFIFMHVTYGLELDPGIAVLRGFHQG